MGIFHRMSIFEAVADAVCFVNFLCSVSIMLFDHWLGLNICSDPGKISLYGNEKYIELQNEDWFKITQTFTTSGFICFLLALPFAIIKPLLRKDRDFLEYMACGLSLGGAILSMTGWAVYLGNIETSVLENNKTADFSFGCAVVTSIFGIIAFVFFTLDIMRSSLRNQKSAFNTLKFGSHNYVGDLRKCRGHSAIFGVHAIN